LVRSRRPVCKHHAAGQGPQALLSCADDPQRGAVSPLNVIECQERRTVDRCAFQEVGERRYQAMLEAPGYARVSRGFCEKGCEFPIRRLRCPASHVNGIRYNRKRTRHREEVGLGGEDRKPG
jgi:hypothetical protein